MKFNVLKKNDEKLAAGVRRFESSSYGVKTWTYCAFRESLRKTEARFKRSLLAFCSSTTSINHLPDQSCSPQLTGSTHWPGAKPVSGQGPDPWTLAGVPGPMGWGHQSYDPGSPGYLLLWHNTIGHSHQNDGAHWILHADHSNGCWPKQAVVSAPLKYRKIALLMLCHRCLFCAFFSFLFCLLSILCFKVSWLLQFGAFSEELDKECTICQSSVLIEKPL